MIGSVGRNKLENNVRTSSSQSWWANQRVKAAASYLMVTSGLVALLLVNSCASTSTTPTGIELPPDPTIQVPDFQKDAASFEESKIGTPQMPEMKAAPVTEPVVEKKVKKVVEKVKATKETMTKETKENKPPEKFEVLPAYRIPFEVGEKQEIAMGWMGLPAGTAILEVRKGLPFYGRETLHLWGNILSSKLVDAIYHVDNTAESFVDATGLIPYKFLLHMVETQQKKETRVSFDHTQKKAFYWSKRISKRWGDENQDRVDDLVPGAKDLWSGIYYARTLNFKPGEKQVVWVYENGKNYKVELTQIGREIVNSKVGSLQCLKISVVITLDNVLRPTGDVFMWLSDDSKRFLVKFEAKIKIGSLYGNLVSVRERK